MLDFHTHILPGMDDGAKTLAISSEMLQRLHAQGCREVLLTPHFYPDTEPLSTFLRRRGAAVAALSTAQFPADMKLYLGCETALSPLLFVNEDLQPALIAGTKLMLTELSYTDSFQEKTFQMLEKLIYEHGITPVIAHLERYPNVKKSAAAVVRLLRMGCKIQLNSSAFHGSFLKNHWAFHLLESEAVSFIGSDCHNLDTRAPNYGEAVQAISKKAPAMLPFLEKRAASFCASAIPIIQPQHT